MSGLLAFEADGGTIVGTSRASGVHLDGAHGMVAVFSPDGRHVSVDADSPAVYETASGQRVRLDVGDRAFAAGYEWLDQDTLAVIAAKGDSAPIELLECQVPDGPCRSVEPDIGGFDHPFALPGGVPMGLAAAAPEATVSKAHKVVTRHHGR